MRIIPLFFLLMSPFLTIQINGAQPQNPDASAGYGEFGVKTLISSGGQLATHVGLVALDKCGVETSKNKTERQYQEKQVDFVDEQTIGAKLGIKIQSVQLIREKITTLNEQREAITKHFARAENKTKLQEKEIALAMIDIDLEAAFDRPDAQKKQGTITRDGKTYKEMENAVKKLKKGSDKDKQEKIKSFEDKMDEIHSEVKGIKKERKNKIEVRKEEKRKEIEKKYQDKEKNKENTDKTRTSLFTKIMAPFAAAATAAGHGLDFVADKSFAHITKLGCFKDTFVATNAKNINRVLVISTIALLSYGSYKLYNKYSNDDEDVYDNDEEDDDDTE